MRARGRCHHPRPSRWTTTIRVDPEDIDLEENEQPENQKLRQPPWLAVGVYAEFAAVLPVSFLLDLLNRLAEDLPTRHAEPHVGRSLGQPWLVVQPVEDSWDQAVYRHAEVRAGLRWLRSHPDPPRFKPRVH